MNLCTGYLGGFRVRNMSQGNKNNPRSSSDQTMAITLTVITIVVVDIVHGVDSGTIVWNHSTAPAGRNRRCRNSSSTMVKIQKKLNRIPLTVDDEGINNPENSFDKP